MTSAARSWPLYVRKLHGISQTHSHPVRWFDDTHLQTGSRPDDGHPVGLTGGYSVIYDRPATQPDLPEGVTDQLRRLDDDGLRGIIDYVHELLDEHQHHQLEERVDEIPDEELVSVTEHEGYLEAVRGHRCAEGCSDCPHGAYLYHVRTSPRPSGALDVRWEFIGPVRRE